MSNETQVIVVSIDKLKELISNGIKEHLAPFEQRLIEALQEKKPLSDRLYTKEVADYLNISRQTVNAHAKEGTLPKPRYNGRRAYWLKEELKEHIKKTNRVFNVSNQIFTSQDYLYSQ